MTRMLCKAHEQIPEPYKFQLRMGLDRRRVVSRVYTGILNVIMGRRLKYYCGWVIHRTDLVRSLPHITTSFSFQAGVLCEVLRQGASILEVDSQRHTNFGISWVLLLR
jgi:hypothetical protein